MITRQLTGQVITPAGVGIQTGALRVTPIDAVADAASALAVVGHEYPIADGVVTGTIVAPARYLFEVLLHGGSVVWRFVRSVAEVSTPTTLQEIYLSDLLLPEIAPSAVIEGSEVTRLGSGSQPAGRIPVADGAGGIRWSDAGSGDMITEVYDPDRDGKVTAAVTADVAPWEGITDKPATFPPTGHAASHSAGGGDAVSPADIGAAPASHTHPGSEVTSQVASAAAADSVPWEGIAGKPSAYPPEAHAASHASGASDAVTPAAIGALPLNGKIVTVTSSRELALSDAGAILLCTGTITVTAPNGLPHGFNAAIANVGTGTVTLDAVGELKTTDNHRTLARQCTAATIIYDTVTNAWYAFGPLTT